MSEQDISVFDNYLRGKSQEAYLEEQRRQREQAKTLVADIQNQIERKTIDEPNPVDIARAIEDARELPVPLLDVLEEMFRQARAYGWEIGNGAQWAATLPSSPENPFLQRDWMRHIYDSQRTSDIGKDQERGSDNDSGSSDRGPEADDHTATC
ncbi:hypothetical protein KC887_05080 [Candidatus Kaiserbacteria bacterium]|nr:hypothetical protein [Candidatus Kaiserbacteria bacterium]